jgi:BirA family transcriptional regulator, biotin operon repressor / biotin---[acetyl-CoA-carboxylase] ligase
MSLSRVALLRALDERAPKSVSTLGAALGATAVEVREAVDSLRELGCEIIAAPGKGFRIASAFDALDETSIAARLAGTTPAVELKLFEEIDSTNAFLLHEAAAGAESGLACIAEIQTAGRGRRGRTWFAAPGASLAFSLLWRFEQPLDFLAGLSLAAGVAVVRVLRRLGAEEVRLKWPNDIVHRHHKLAGILVETQGGGLAPSVAVIGIGINLRLPKDIRERIDQAVTDVASIAPALPTRSELAASLLSELAAVLEQFAGEGFGGISEEWTALHAYHGQAVQMHFADNRRISGNVTGVAADGALLVDTGSGVQKFYSGEISLRAA